MATWIDLHSDSQVQVEIKPRGMAFQAWKVWCQHASYLAFITRVLDDRTTRPLPHHFAS